MKINLYEHNEIVAEKVHFLKCIQRKLLCKVSMTSIHNIFFLFARKPVLVIYCMCYKVYGQPV